MRRLAPALGVAVACLALAASAAAMTYRGSGVDDPQMSVRLQLGAGLSQALAVGAVDEHVRVLEGDRLVGAELQADRHLRVVDAAAAVGHRRRRGGEREAGNRHAHGRDEAPHLTTRFTSLPGTTISLTTCLPSMWRRTLSLAWASPSLSLIHISEPTRPY